MTYQWVDYEPDFVRRRYDQIAGAITFFEWLLFLPAQFRQRAAENVARRGERILEIGCGTGRNLPHLSEAVGPRGHVYGIDLSDGMLAHAHEICREKNLTNVTLSREDATNYVAPSPLDGVLFGLSYNTMPNHLHVLRNALAQLRPGGRVVIMDAKVPDGFGSSVILPFGLWLMRHTLLGNPLIRPWEHLADATEHFEMQEFLFGSYYICRGIKSGPATVRESARAEIGTFAIA